MAKLNRKNGSTSNILRVFLPDSASTSGAGKTGLTTGSAGLTIGTIADVEATTTAYSSTNLETITTLGTFAAPTAGKCRFKEVDATNHPGLYEVQIADARFAVTNAKSLIVSITATGVVPTNVEIDHGAQVDTVYVSGTAQTARDLGASVLVSAGTGTGQLDITSGRIKADTVYWAAAAVATPDTAGYPKVTVKSGTGTGELNLTSGVVQADAAKIATDATAAANAKAYFNGTGYADLILRGNITAVTSQTRVTIDNPLLSDNLIGCRVVIRRATTKEAIIGVVTSTVVGEEVLFTPDGTPDYTITVGDALEILLPTFAAPDRTELAAIKTKTDYLPSATAGSAGGVFIAGTNAPVTITGSGTALTIVSAGANGAGITISGVGTGPGVEVNGGITGRGVNIAGGATSGDAIYVSASSGDGISVHGGGTTGSGAVFARGGTSGDDVRFTNDDCEVNADIAKLLGTPWLTPAVAGTPDVNTKYISGDSAAADNCESYFDGTGYGGLLIGGNVTTVTSQTRVTIDNPQLTNHMIGSRIIIRRSVTGDVMTGIVTGTAAGEEVLFVLDHAAEYTIAIGDKISIVTPGESVDKIWDEVQSGHTSTGTFGKYLDSQVSLISGGGGGGTAVDPTNVDRSHTWTFANSSQLTATNTLAEYITSFNGLLAMDFTNAIPAKSAIQTVTAAVFENIAGTEPTVGTLTKSLDYKKAHIAVDARSATAGTYTLAVTVLTTDNQTFTRKGRFTVS